MALSMQERKAAQRLRPEGYAKSRECDWKQQQILDASFTNYLSKLVQQNYGCSICGEPINNRSPLDHDHNTGLARGVLCNPCNLLLGKFEAGSNQFLANASDYLAAWSQE